MICEELARDACPCVLADIGHCRCCSLLMGKEICQCDYPGTCIYEKHRWEDAQPTAGHDQIIAIFPHTAYSGLVIQWKDSGAAVPGLQLSLSQQDRDSVSATVLAVYPDSGAVALLPQVQLKITAGGNVFGRDAIHLQRPQGQSIQIITDNALLALASVLADGFRRKAASVSVLPISGRPRPDADLLLFISSDPLALQRSLKAIPYGSKARSAFWFVE